MDHDERYFRALGIAMRLIAFARGRPDAAEHDLVAYFVYTLLAALAVEEEQARKVKEASWCE
jgi:hypothetical protein